MSLLLSEHNPIYRNYVFWTGVLVLKMLAMSILTGCKRFFSRVHIIILCLQKLNKYSDHITIFRRPTPIPKTFTSTRLRYRSTTKMSNAFVVPTETIWNALFHWYWSDISTSKQIHQNLWQFHCTLMPQSSGSCILSFMPFGFYPNRRGQLPLLFHVWQPDTWQWWPFCIIRRFPFRYKLALLTGFYLHFANIKFIKVNQTLPNKR